MEQEAESLSAEEKAYFDSRGEAEIKPAEAEKPDAGVEAEPEADASPELADDLGEADASQAPDGEGKDAEKHRVPLHTLTKERSARKEAERRAIAAEEGRRVLEDRWNQMLAVQQPKETAEPAKEIDPAVDPVGALAELVQGQRAQRAAEADRQKAEKEQSEQQAAWTRKTDIARSQYQSAAAEDATFEPTYNALRQVIGEELMDLYGLTIEQARHEVDRYEAQQIEYCVDRGIDVADHLRKLAKARRVTAPAQASNDPKPDPAKEIERLADAVDGATTLSGAGGAPIRTLDAEAIANMKPDEFEAWLGKPGNQAKFRKLAGG
ncbi:hypothetical protein [Paradevosia shaoguanensis]|uniref:hypothetical protein n=1 Tax=Paradevosia shaoguanensis TaxID=1335043 RepID=UPI001933D210|nr:hypothetical protein [Paradevosia shaoguanensis]